MATPASPFSYQGMMKAAQNTPVGGLVGAGLARYRQMQLRNQANANSAPTPAEQDMATNYLSAANGTTGADANANAQPGAMSNFAGEGPQDGAGGDMGGPDAGPELGMDAFSTGTIVTKPTIALLGDKGVAERIVPLNNNPDNKVNSAVIPRYRTGMR